MSKGLRIYLTGVGGQGTLTATTLLSRTALDQGIDVVSGEIHGMAQRGGVVESTVLLGGWLSPRIDHGEADILVGFELLETLRALPYLAPAGCVFSAEEFVPPPGVSMGREKLPDREEIQRQVRAAAARSWFLPLQTLGREAGSVRSGNSAMLGALCAAGGLPFGPQALEKSIRKHLSPRLVDVNLRALERGVRAVQDERKS
jgi:indolepyruvate ferredoxin oxidoreductase beta subunit